MGSIIWLVYKTNKSIEYLTYIHACMSNLACSRKIWTKLYIIIVLELLPPPFHLTCCGRAFGTAEETDMAIEDNWEQLSVQREGKKKLHVLYDCSRINVACCCRTQQQVISSHPVVNLGAKAVTVFLVQTMAALQFWLIGCPSQQAVFAYRCNRNR